MVMERFNPPPPLSTPKDLPWVDAQAVIQRLDRLITLMERPSEAGPPQVITIPGAPGSATQLIHIMQEMVPESIGNSAVLTFQKTIAVNYQDEQERQVPFHGVIKEVVMGYPAGCQQLVEVRLIYYPKDGGKEYIIPTLEDSFIALDDVTVMFTPRYSVRAPGNLQVEWWNYDSLNTHVVPVIATISPTRLEIG